MIVHKLKTHPEFFNELWKGNKKFEVRKDDRSFAIGDRLRLQEYFPQENRHSGREVAALIAYKMTGEEWGIKEGYCILSLADIRNYEEFK